MRTFGFRTELGWDSRQVGGDDRMSEGHGRVMRKLQFHPMNFCNVLKLFKELIKD